MTKTFDFLCTMAHCQHEWTRTIKDYKDDDEYDDLECRRCGNIDIQIIED